MDKLMKKYKVLLLLFLAGGFIVSCSNLTKNTVREAGFTIKNGVVADKKWTEDLRLNRLSWHHEMTLQFDLMMGNILPQSGFNFWFSRSEQSLIDKCSDFRIVMAYSQDTKYIPYSYLNDQIKNAGFQKIELTEFKANLLQHPDSELNSLRLYQIFGICRIEKSPKPLIFNFPGYSEVTLN